MLDSFCNLLFILLCLKLTTFLHFPRFTNGFIYRSKTL
nr:MAG TPA: hypothetical protein [Caudoviricetes sp.]